MSAPNLLTRKQLALIRDRDWRLDNLYRIVNETGQNVAFVRNDVQQRMWDELWFWNIILKGRQHGISSSILLLRAGGAASLNTTCHRFKSRRPAKCFSR